MSTPHSMLYSRSIAAVSDDDGTNIVVSSSSEADSSGPHTRGKAGAAVLRRRAHSSRLSYALAIGALTLTIVGIWRLCALEGQSAVQQHALGGPHDVAVEAEVVWWAAYLTAASTALGAVPFMLSRNPAEFSTGVLGVANAVAAAMMCVASASLAWEGAASSDGGVSFRPSRPGGSPSIADAVGGVRTGSSDRDPFQSAAAATLGHGARSLERAMTEKPATLVSSLTYALLTLPPWQRTALGVLLGVVLIVACKRLLERWEHVSMGFLEGAGARKALLIVAVMFLHSATEGIGIGVSFGVPDRTLVEATAAAAGAGAGGSGIVRSVGDGITPSAVPAVGDSIGASPFPTPPSLSPSSPPPASLGRFVSLSMGLHNVPEGLATALALVPRGTPPLEAALWALATSLSQPLLAVPAFMAVHAFLPLLPVGLGFAAGAMGWVALVELLPEAAQELGGYGRAMRVAVPAGALMCAAQLLMR